MIKLYLKLAALFFLSQLHGQIVNEGLITIESNTIVSLYSSFTNKTEGLTINSGSLFVHKNWKNDGLVDYNLDVGSTNFVGIETQRISGTSANVFSNVLFENTSSLKPFELYGKIHVGKEADFKAGIVDNSFGGAFIFKENANHIHASNASYVEGEVVKIGDSSFIFPVGEKDYLRTAKISTPENSTEKISAHYFYENSNAKYSHSLREEGILFICPNEYWTISNPTANSYVRVTLSWNENTTAKTLLNTDANTAIHIVRWDTNKKLWVDEGGVIDRTKKTVSTVAEVLEYGVFALANVIEETADAVKVFNIVTPNDDGSHDFLRIDGLEEYPENSIQVFNRWGVQIFKTERYTKENSFKGLSDARVTINSDKKIPSGTYFYVLKYKNQNQQLSKTGYIYVSY